MQLKIGDKIGRLTLNKFFKTTNPSVKYWECQCECGLIKDVKEFNIERGFTQSCGCLAKETTSQVMTTHGFSKMPKGSMERKTYTTWLAMLSRCKKTEYNKNANSTYYKNNIQVCERWRGSFSNFLEDMGLKPTRNHSIDRINNLGNYEPNNCRWALAKIQSNNRSSNLILEFHGRKMTLSEWADFLNRPTYLIQRRLADGWSIEKALTTKSGPSEKWPKVITFNGKSATFKELASKSGLTIPQIHKRLARGWSIEKCVSEPLAEFNRVTPDELEFNGEILPVSEWAEKIQITAEELRRRLTRGWSVERAVTQKSKKTTRSLDNTKNLD